MNSYPFLLFCLTLFFISCDGFKDWTPKEIYGKWVLDSTSGRSGKLIAGGPREHTEFTLQKNKSFVFKWSDFDVFGYYTGTFDYIQMKDTLQPLLVFSIRASEMRDSVIRLDSLIILKLNDSILKTQEKETYTLLDSTVVTQNRINVYKISHAPDKGF